MGVTLTQALETVAKLAREVELGLPVGPGAVRLSETGDVVVKRPPQPSRHHFFLDGLLFHVAITPGESETLFQIWAEIGWMPYTIESPDKRAQLQAVLRSALWLDQARFVVDDSQKILVLGQRKLPGVLTLSDMMYETVQFMQQARPYLRVLGQYL
ncbi:hypothetical protein [Oleisolibacter albus]|uniref:hypothetical protein n=1 Tax=Oleisolibacter albus TaxID=2171757 RepID=UPI000DF48A3D|nr:hypothetical protein [Oleisolibacter albus]